MLSNRNNRNNNLLAVEFTIITVSRSGHDADEEIILAIFSNKKRTYSLMDFKGNRN